MEVVVRFSNVDKVYKLDRKRNYKLKNILINLIRKKESRKKVKVLENINFSINEGERVAFLGKNGSGKSTILKMITEVTYPTSGTVTVKRKVNALLELNSGFEIDFTGRENIYLKGMLLGLSKSEIKKIENDIVEFADIGEYIDYPISTYSTGMKSRLGFAIAIHVEPEILVVDEALSVGDEEFKYKCLDKIEEITSKEKLTLILVTHSTDTAMQFCKRGIVLEKGKILYDGVIKSAVSIYKKTIKRSKKDV